MHKHSPIELHIILKLPESVTEICQGNKERFRGSNERCKKYEIWVANGS